jgi:hypothetical protein
VQRRGEAGGLRSGPLVQRRRQTEALHEQSHHAVVPPPGVAARRRTLRSRDRRVELRLHLGRALPQETAIPGKTNTL